MTYLISIAVLPTAPSPITTHFIMFLLSKIKLYKNNKYLIIFYHHLPVDIIVNIKNHINTMNEN